MGTVLAHDVHVTHEDNTVTILKAGTKLPKKFEKLVPNPKAFVEVEDEATEESGAGDGADDKSYAKLTPTKLRALLKKRELPQEGEKAELIARLEEFDEESDDTADGDDESGAGDGADDDTEE